MIMKFKSNQLSGPKIKELFKVFPFLLNTYGSEPFYIPDAIQRINNEPELDVWCHDSSPIKEEEKKKYSATKRTSLDLQNACHCFKGKTQSAVIEIESGMEVRLFEDVDIMKYRIAPTIFSK